MIFVSKHKISEVPRVTQRKLCKECRFYRRHCFMCLAIADEVLTKWLDNIQNRELYILSGAKFSTRKQKCPWCKEPFTKEHLQEAHHRKITDYWLYETQQQLNMEVRQVRRTGRWWALPATLGMCQRCSDPSGLTCSLGISAVTNVRCINGLGLDPRELVGDLETWEAGFIIA